MAIVVPDPETLEPWAKEKGIRGDMASLCKNEVCTSGRRGIEQDSFFESPSSRRPISGGTCLVSVRARCVRLQTVRGLGLFSICEIWGGGGEMFMGFFRFRKSFLETSNQESSLQLF